MMPLTIWEIITFGALFTTLYSLFGNDNENYTDVISSVLATILWFVAGISALTGIQNDAGDIWSASWLMWLCISAGVIIGIITYTKIIDVTNKRKDHVSMKLNTRL